MAIKILPQKNAIQQVKVDTTLNHSEGPALDMVGANFGLPRPIFGFKDPLYRALIRNFALQPKLILDAFRRGLELLFGPQKSIIQTYTQKVRTGDQYVRLADTERQSQYIRTRLTDSISPAVDRDLATAANKILCLENTDQFENGSFEITINPGGENEEIVYVSKIQRPIRDTLSLGVDPSDTSMVLNDASLFPDPSAVPDYFYTYTVKILNITPANVEEVRVTSKPTNSLSSGVSGTITTLPLDDSTQFPDSSTNYDVVINRGTATEETITITGKSGNDLTLSSTALSFSHSAEEPVEALNVLYLGVNGLLPYSVPQYFHSAGTTIETPSFATLSGSVQFEHQRGETIELRRIVHEEIPQCGLLVLNPEDPTDEESIEFKLNDIAHDFLQFSDPVEMDHSVDLIYGSKELKTIAKVGTTELFLKTPATVPPFPMSDFFISISNGNANAETIFAGYNDTDLENPRFVLKNPLNYEHQSDEPIIAPYTYVCNTLKEPLYNSVGTITQIELRDGTDFPNPSESTEYTIIINRGHENEELIHVAGKSTNILTFPSYELQHDHLGGELVEIVTAIIRGTGWTISQVGENHVVIGVPLDLKEKMRLQDVMFIHPKVLDPEVTTETEGTANNTGEFFLYVLDGSDFPRNGLILLDEGTAEEETIFYVNNNHFGTKLNRFINGGRTLVVQDVSGFPDASSGNTFNVIVDRDGSPETHTVSGVDRTAVTTLNAPFLVGETNLTVNYWDTYPVLGSGPSATQIRIGRGTQNEEVVSAYGFSSSTALVFSPGTKYPHAEGEIVEVITTGILHLDTVPGTFNSGIAVEMFPTKFTLNPDEEGLTKDHDDASTVKLIQTPYVGTLLEDGSADNNYLGSYVYDTESYAPTQIETTITREFPGTTNTVGASLDGGTTFLIASSVYFVSGAEFSVRLGVGTVREEIVEIASSGVSAYTRLSADVGITKTNNYEYNDTFTVHNTGGVSTDGFLGAPQFVKIGGGERLFVAEGSLSSGVTEGDTYLPMTNTNMALFPGLYPDDTKSDVAEDFYVILDKGTTKEELVHIKEKVGPLEGGAPTPTGITAELGIKFDHDSGCSVRLVVSVDRSEIVKVTYNSVGTVMTLESGWHLKYAHAEEEPVTLINPESELTLKGGSSLRNDHPLYETVEPLVYVIPVADASFFPADTGGVIIINHGGWNEEILEFDQISVNDIEFDEPIVFQYPHAEDESVTLSTKLSIPRVAGEDYALYVPPDPYAVINTILNLIKAEGVTISFEEI